MIPYKAPGFGVDAFNCPHCGAYSDQEWYKAYWYNNGYINLENLYLVFCAHCKEYTLWHKGKMIYPYGGNAPLPNSDLPPNIIDDYEEARSIVSLSPRGAAALLRLAIQKICKHLGEKGENINEDIANLVKKGLPERLQKALDIVRVVGNSSVHPGQIDLNDNPETAEKLFNLVNLISDVMITQPKHVDDLYNKIIPEGQKEAIDKRDGKA